MIVQLTGTLIAQEPGSVVLDVGGVGFELGVSAATAATLPPISTPDVRLFTRLNVREDAMTLYGFASSDERLLFDKLCQVTGVGPKLALAVLSTFSVPDLVRIVSQADAELMSRVPGVGKKLASRLVLELESALAKEAHFNEYAAGGSSTSSPAIAASVEDDVSQALLSMGFSSQEVGLALEGFDQSGATTPEQVIAYALKRLGAGA